MLIPLGGGGIPLAKGGGGGAMFGGGGGATIGAGGCTEACNGLIGGGGEAPKDGATGLLKDAVGDVEDGEGVTGLVAASIAFIFASLSPLSANIIPDNIPVKNVEIGTSISKNFWSMGEIAFNG